MRWLGHDVLLTTIGVDRALLVGVTWWDAATGVWGGSRVLSTDELAVTVAAVDALLSIDPPAATGRVRDLAVLFDRLLDH